MLVRLPQEARQLDDMPEMRDASGEGVLLEGGPADVLLVRVALWTPTGARTGAKPGGQKRQKEEEASMDMQCPKDGGADALCPNGAGTETLRT